MLHANLMALYFTEPQTYGRSQIYIAGIGIFDLFALVTVTLTR